jgi:hypothetical protein
MYEWMEGMTPLSTGLEEGVFGSEILGMGSEICFADRQSVLLQDIDSVGLIGMY